MISLRVRCSGRLHRILYHRGRLSLPDHCVEAELAAVKLGGEACKCIKILLAFSGELSLDYDCVRGSMVPTFIPRGLRKHVERALLRRGNRYHERLPKREKSWGPFDPELLAAVITRVMSRIAEELKNQRRVEVRLGPGDLRYVIGYGYWWQNIRDGGLGATRYHFSWTQCKQILRVGLAGTLWIESVGCTLTNGSTTVTVKNERPKCWSK